MRHRKGITAAASVLVVALTLLAIFVGPSQANDRDDNAFRAKLIGFNEVPANSTTGRGTFRAQISESGNSLHYELSYRRLEATASAAHIHIGQSKTNGGVVAFLCGGTGAPDCPASGTVTGTIDAGDVVGPAAQGIDAGQFAELLRAMRAGATYVNVHSSKFPGGEIRGQVGR
jgi:CHRD domain-containing protein